MNIIFFGTSAFAAKILANLIEHGIHIVAVVTRPDRPQGRELKALPSAVKQYATTHHPKIPLLQPEKVSTEENEALLKGYHADLFVVVAFGEILKEFILNIPKHGAINVHASLLPKYRGAAPMQRCLMNGDKETGITIIEMTRQMDAGAILAQEKIPVPEEMTLGELDEKLLQIAPKTLLSVIDRIKKGTVRKISQDLSLVTLAPKISVEEEKIDWKLPAQKIHNQIRALSPKPGAWCYLMLNQQKKRLKIFKSQVVINQSGSPGETLHINTKEWIIACGQEGIRLLEVQLEGKKRMAVSDFLKGIPGQSLQLS